LRLLLAGAQVARWELHPLKNVALSRRTHLCQSPRPRIIVAHRHSLSWILAHHHRIRTTTNKRTYVISNHYLARMPDRAGRENTNPGAVVLIAFPSSKLAKVIW